MLLSSPLSFYRSFDALSNGLHRLRYYSPWIFVLVAGCARPDFSGTGLCKKDGTPECPCYANRSCDGGLVCIADTCKAPIKSFPDSAEADQELPESGSSSETEEPESSDDPSQTQEDSSPESTSSESESKGGDSSNQDQAPSCSDRKKNGDESDLDCGGLKCPACGLGRLCGQDRDCRSQRCIKGRCSDDCRSDADCQSVVPCREARCDTELGLCTHPVSPNGKRCDDSNPCTSQDTCVEGHCRGQDTVMLNEHFEHSDHGWQFLRLPAMGPEFDGIAIDPNAPSSWSIGIAQSSDCGRGSSYTFLEDPAVDHTPHTNRNGIAGVVIGGCHQQEGDNAQWDCLVSPQIKSEHFDEAIIFSFWRHLHSVGALTDSRRPGVYNRVIYLRGDSPNMVVLEEGPDEAINDREWGYHQYEIPKISSSSIAVGICFLRRRYAPDFPGWSVDDLKVRQAGCMQGM